MTLSIGSSLSLIILLSRPNRGSSPRKILDLRVTIQQSEYVENFLRGEMLQNPLAGIKAHFHHMVKSFIAIVIRVRDVLIFEFF